MSKYKEMTYTTRKDDKRCIKKVTLDGKAHFLSASTPHELYNKYQELLRKYHRDELNESTTNVETWSNKWLKTYKRSNEKRTQKFYEDIVKAYIIPSIGLIKLKDLKQIDIINMLNDMEDKGLTRARVYTLQTINQILNKAVENDLINKNVALGIKKPHYKAKEKQVIPQSVIDKLSTIEDDDCFMFEFLIYTGLRRGELVPLTIDDVDLKNKLIKINKAVYFEHNKPKLKGTKTNENRNIPIFDIIYDKLSALVLKRENYLFTSSTGTIMTEQSMRRKLEKVNKLVDYNFTYHQCRHTFVTLMYNAEIDVKQAQRWSGHKDIGVLLNIYTHLDEKNNQKSIEKMNQKLRKSCGIKIKSRGTHIRCGLCKWQSRLLI